MPIWSRKGKERAVAQAEEDGRRPLVISAPMGHQSGQPEPFVHVTPDPLASISSSSSSSTSAKLDNDKDKTAWLQIEGHWYMQNERMKTRAKKVLEVEGNCSLAHLAAQEAASEADLMHTIIKNPPFSAMLLKDWERPQILEAYRDRGDFFVPSSIGRLALEQTVGFHETCCCREVKSDPRYAWNLSTARSFRGEHPIRENLDTSQGGSKELENDQGGSSKVDREKSVLNAVHETAPEMTETSGYLNEDAEAPPSYKEAVS